MMASSIPLIDLGEWLDLMGSTSGEMNEERERERVRVTREVVAAVREASHTLGFFYVANHGVPTGNTSRKNKICTYIYFFSQI